MKKRIVFFIFCIIVIVLVILSWGRLKLIIVEQQASNAHNSGNFKSAIEHYNILLEYRPNDPHLVYDLGIAYIEVKDYKKAMEMVKKLKALGDNELSEKLGTTITTGKSL